MTDVIVKRFSELSVDQLYDILQLRNAVFAVEQNCIYPECDDYDRQCSHAMMYDPKGLCAYARILPPGSKYPEASIGRVVVRADRRGQGIAKTLMQVCIANTKKDFSNPKIKIMAQDYLENFYQTFGFVRIGEPFDDHGIMHVNMVMP